MMLDEMDRMWVPVERSWRLNERHYGALQGLNKAQTVAQHGEAQVKVWRRSYDIPPPPLAADDTRHPRFDARYAGVARTLSCPPPSPSRTPWRGCCRSGTRASRRNCAPAATSWSWRTATACAPW